MPFVNCDKFNTSQALQDQAIADLAQELLTKQNALKDCSGNPLAGNVPTCAQMTTAIQTAIDALPADKFLQGLQSYNPATNTMTLLMSDGSTVDIDMTDLLADAVSGGTSAGITVQDEGSVLTTAATSLNFIGTAITATSAGGAVSVDVDAVTPAQMATTLANYVDTTTYNAGQAAQDAAIATKVDTATYNSDQAAQNVVIASKVDTTTYNAGQAAQDAAIALKQNALNDCSGNPLAGTVPTCAQMNTAISSAISGGATPTGAAGGDLQGTYPNPTVNPASTTQAGKVELATTAEATAGTSTTLAVTPAGLKAAIDAAPDSDAQTLTLAGNQLSISNGNTVTISGKQVEFGTVLNNNNKDVAVTFATPFPVGTVPFITLTARRDSSKGSEFAFASLSNTGFTLKRGYVSSSSNGLQDIEWKAEEK